MRVNINVKVLFLVAFLLSMLVSLQLSLSPVHTSGGMLVNDKLAHYLGYFVMVMMLDFAYSAGRYLIFKIGLIVGYSIVIEVAQNYIPGRDMSIHDLLANGLGVFSFILLLPYIQKFQFYRRLI